MVRAWRHAGVKYKRVKTDYLCIGTMRLGHVIHCMNEDLKAL